MISLKKIEMYVDKIAGIISSVLDLQVIICDSKRYIIGDSHLSNYKIERVGRDSILSEAMKGKTDIVLYDKKDSQRCRACSNYKSCDIEAIVGVAIVHESELIGGIEILANTLEKKNELIKNQKNYLSFIHEMSELLIIKFFEEERNTQLHVLKERLANIIDSIDHAIVATDENGNIIYHNSRLNEFVDIEFFEKEISLTGLIKTDYLEKLHSESRSFKNREIKFDNGLNSIYALMSGKPIIVKDENIGSIISIKKLMDVYNEINEISNIDIEMDFDDIIGKSEKILSVKQKAALVANSQSSVLITGESGTGKELTARAPER